MAVCPEKVCMSEGVIFDIIRNSFVDGPGIRTAVFFKGCNLRCAWCHNPESQSAEPELMLFESKCTHCGRCREVCPHGLAHCRLCGACVHNCPSGARSICGRSITAEALLQELLKDRMFYELSGGGVTFSGGECMLQTDFLCDILKRCKAQGLHTAVDTAGCVPWAHFEKVLPYTDAFLYDVKCADDELHKRYTGVSNKLILENLRQLSASFSGELIIRIPMIAGVNDTPAELENLSALLHSIKYKAVELLPYHRMGEHKYTALGKPHTPFAPPPPKTLNRLKTLLK